MPLVGVKGVIEVGAAIQIAVGISGVLRASGQRGPAFASTADALGILGTCALLVQFDVRRLTAGVYRTGDVSQPQESKVRYLRDGKTATISVVETRGIVAIATNGKPDAAIMMAPNINAVEMDEVTMVLAAALPVSMHSHPQRVANIGIGSGLTTHTLLSSPRVHSVDSIEIEPLKVEAARLGFYPRNRNLFDDSRSHIYLEDAKTFFSLQHEGYDVIVAEPSNPWVSGVATLFSQEFYSRVKRYLKPDGIFVQWLQIYETHMTVVASIVSSPSANFADYAIYNVDYSNLLIVATQHTPLPEPGASIFAEAGLRDELNHVGVRNLADLESRHLGHKRTVDSLIASYGSPANSHYFPFVDLNAPRLRFMQRSAVELPSTLLLPMPMIEMLSAREANAATVPTTVVDTDLASAHAAAIDAAFVRSSTEALERSTASDVLAIQIDEASCKIAGADAVWRNAVRSIADVIANKLPPEARRRIWGKIESAACATHANVETRNWLTLLEAVATRDAVAMREAAQVLLRSPAMLRGPADLAYVVTAQALAEVRMGKEQEATRLLKQHYGPVELPQALELPIRWLRACAASNACVKR